MEGKASPLSTLPTVQHSILKSHNWFKSYGDAMHKDVMLAKKGPTFTFKVRVFAIGAIVK